MRTGNHGTDEAARDKLERPGFDQLLIERYGGEGPRYTSYPTAVQFNQDFTGQHLLAAIDESNCLPIPADLSVYVHVPFCSSPCFYCGCNRVITRDQAAGDRFLDALDREMALLAPRFDPDRKVRQIHLGGGTPTFLDNDQLGRLTKLLRGRFALASEVEMGLEIDPRTIAPEAMEHLRALGYNRLSIGIQDFDPDVQRAVNRVHDFEQVASLHRAARATGFASISFDLIYGLPEQSTAGFQRTIEAVLELAPDRLSLFNYAHLPHLFKAQRRIDELQLPTPATKLAIFRNTLTQLLDAGYDFIGMDHFARPDDSLAQACREKTMTRNFQGYSTLAGLDLISFGPSAISQIGDCFAQNDRGLSGWTAALEQGHPATVRGLKRNTDDQLRAEVITRIMCNRGLVFRDLEQLFELKFRRYFARELEALEPIADDGLIEWTAQGLRVTAQGLLFLRAIARCFDAYLAPAASGKGRFSRIV